MQKIDARGLLCPEPVLRVQKAVLSKPEELLVLVDAVAAKENVTRFASSRGYAIETSEDGGEYTLTLKKKQ